MEFSNLKYEREGKVGILTVNRPKVLNALNKETVKEIREAALKIKEAGDVNVLIITGEGDKAFIAGADISEFKDLGLREGFDFSRNFQEMTNVIENLGIPVIAMVNGLALGGGCEVALACTLRILSESARLGLPELGLGVIPGAGGTQRLSRIIGKGRALWYILTGDLIGANEALEMGLANLVVEPAKLKEKTLEVAQKICSKGPLAVKLALHAVNFGMEADLQTGLVLEAAMANVATGTQDAKEGVASFLGKRKPNFKGE
ncbi:MAG: enoyl-CoA hydratase/isomerase family protein [Deltaproteobacteria bacterium]|nr:enoyl-CoA hydratase/isomerase family protein [Deltaproteobacteria bacterium]